MFEVQGNYPWDIKGKKVAVARGKIGIKKKEETRVDDLIGYDKGC